MLSLVIRLMLISLPVVSKAESVAQISTVLSLSLTLIENGIARVASNKEISLKMIILLHLETHNHY